MVGNGGSNGGKWTNLFVPAIIAAISASGGLYIALGTPVGQNLTRPDPFTGTQASELIYRLDAIEVKIDGHLSNHPDIANQFDRRITTLEVRIDQILKNQERILNNLENGGD